MHILALLIKLTFWDLLVYSKTIYGEARGEPELGQAAVAHVILNRIKDPRWPDSLAKVCMEKKQFSVWNENDPNRMKIQDLNLTDPVFLKSLYVGLGALLDVVPDPTLGATHYLNIRQANPDWADSSNMRFRGTWGNHTFYYEAGPGD